MAKKEQVKGKLKISVPPKVVEVEVVEEEENLDEAVEEVAEASSKESFTLKDLSKEMSLRYEDFTTKGTYDFCKEVFEVLSSKLQGGSIVSIHGFGNFVFRDRKERVGRNPRTGEAIHIPSKKVVKFKPSNELRVSMKKLA